MKCQRQLLQISWQQFIRNDEVASTTGLLSISEIIRRRRSTLFGHVARLPQDVPVHKAHLVVVCHVEMSLGRPPNDQWKRCLGRPRERQIDQVRKDNGIPPADRGGVRLLVVTEEQRYGPRWLRDNDDDDGADPPFPFPYLLPSLSTCPLPSLPFPSLPSP